MLGSEQLGSGDFLLKSVELADAKPVNSGVAVLRGSCTINISETTTEPTNISKWNIDRGYWGTFNS